MSEYQYYEFTAVDRPLTDKEMAELRAISTRARITPAGFVNYYTFGDLKADPGALLLKYFDAHVYFACWCSASFMIRLPKHAIDKTVLQAFTDNGGLHAAAKKGYWVIRWDLEESENFDRFGEEDGSEWMSQLVPIREELLQGDYRSLYIGWLAHARWDIEDGVEDAFEPMALPGLGELTAAQKALAEFIEVDQDILTGAAIGLPARDHTKDGAAIDAFTASMPAEALRAFAARSLRGESRQAGMDLQARFAAWRREQGESPELPPRALTTLRELAEKARKEREKEEEAARAKVRKKREQERKTRLANLAADFPKAWREVDRLVAKASGHSYDEACRMLLLLLDAYEAHTTRAEFDEAFEALMQDHSRRPAFIRRLTQAGLWKQGGRRRLPSPERGNTD